MNGTSTQRVRRLALCLGWLGAVACSSANPTGPTGAGMPDAEAGCSRTSTGLTALTDSAGVVYEGERGGLYPGGANVMPASHLASGLTLARAIGPLDAGGRADAAGRYAFISVGMSNTTQEFSTFKPLADNDPAKDARLIVVDGAQGGVTAADWSNPGCPCWTVLDSRLRNAGISASQVATAWVKLANRQPSEGWPAHARRLSEDAALVLRLLKSRFPNLVLAYLSSRIYAGYATTPLNPEPYAYQSGLATRWVIEQQLAGALTYDGSAAAAPWIAWGPYLWADGLRGRGDGLAWACSDFNSDGTHPSETGRQKVASRLLEFVRSDPTAREWYLALP